MSKQKDVEAIMQAILVIEDTDLWPRDQQLDILLRLYRLRTYIKTRETLQ